MIENLLKTFNLISQLKGYDWSKFEEDDDYFMKVSYNRVKQHIKYKLWTEIVKKYALETSSDIYTSCDVLLDVVIKKYEK